MWNSDLFAALDTLRRYGSTAVQMARDPEAFASVETCVIFIGHVKSGGSLIGSILDAHPHAVVADEIDIVRYVEAGFRRDQIFHLLRRGARREALKGRVTARRLQPYSLAIPGQWQGAYTNLRVIGDSKPGPTTRRLARDFSLIDRLFKVMDGVSLKFIHVVRSPYDPIGAMVARGGKSLARAIEDYRQRCVELARVRENIEGASLLSVRYEHAVRDPVSAISEFCSFVGLEADPRYLATCAGVVTPFHSAERNLAVWGPRDVDAVRKIIRRTDFLEGYEFDTHLSQEDAR